MILYPKGYFNKVSEISIEYLKENNIKGLILDVDNTLIDYDRNMADDTAIWANMIKQSGLKMCILSNSNNKAKVAEVASKIGVKYIFFGMKPLKIGFKRAKKMLNLNNDEIAVVGDQIFTDVLGANIMKMHSILVEPIKEKDIFVTLIKRPIENAIKKKYLQRTTKTKEKNECHTNFVEKVKIDNDVAKNATTNVDKQIKQREEK